MSGETKKVCNKCGEKKSLDDFSPHKEGKYGRYGHCKACQNVIARQRREEKARREGRPYLPRGLSEEERQERAARSKRSAHLKWRFGITLDEYEAMLEVQDYRCAICRRHQDDFANRFAVDHDHSCCPGKTSCGKCVRSLLCLPCNAGLGSFHDDLAMLDAAKAYLKQHQVMVAA